jgi:hypothetical protein
VLKIYSDRAKSSRMGDLFVSGPGFAGDKLRNKDQYFTLMTLGMNK